MIAEIKKYIASLIHACQQKPKIITSDFEEDTANKPQSSYQVRVIYQRSTRSRDSKLRVFSYSIEVSVKNLRTDDTIQDYVDIISNFLVTKNKNIFIVGDENLGYSNGIWTYEISLEFSLPDNGSEEIIECLKADILPYRLIGIYLTPSFELPTINPNLTTKISP